MDSQGIEAFLAVVRQRNLTDAASTLYISQSTLSHRLAELEKEIGMTLVDRSRGIRAVTLTDYGKEFLVIAKRWNSLVEDTQKIKARTKHSPLTIGSVDTISTFVFPPLYKCLQQHRPQITLSFKTLNSTDLYLSMDREELDIAFALVDIPMKNLISKKLFSEPRVILRKENPPRISGSFINKKDLAPEKEIFFQGDPVYQAWYEHWKEDETIHEIPPVRVDTAQLLHTLLNEDDHWSLVPLCIAKNLAALGPCAYYYLKEAPPERVCYLVKPKHPKTRSIDAISTLESYIDILFPNSYI